MKYVNPTTFPDFSDWINTAQQMTVVDLWTFSLTVPTWDNEYGLVMEPTYYRYCSWDRDVEYDGETWLSNSLLIERDKVRSVVGLEVDRMQVRVFASNDMEIGGLPFMQACQLGLLDGATIKLDRAYFDVDGMLMGIIDSFFYGRASVAKVSRSTAELEVASYLELLNVNMPRSVYQPGCQNTLYDSGCTLSQTAYSREATVLSGSTTTSLNLSLGAGTYDGVFSLGGLLGIVGANSHVLRTVKSWDGNTAVLVSPLAHAPVVGDTFQIWPGCDKTQNTCDKGFDNLVNFRGFPYIPQPETMR